MGFITKLGIFVLILAIIFVIFFGGVIFAPLTGGLDYPVSYGLFAIGTVLLVIGLLLDSRSRHGYGTYYK